MPCLHRRVLTSFPEVADQEVGSRGHDALQQDEEVVHVVEGIRVAFALDGHFDQGRPDAGAREDDSLGDYKHKQQAHIARVRDLLAEEGQPCEDAEIQEVENDDDVIGLILASTHQGFEDKRHQKVKQ